MTDNHELRQAIESMRAAEGERATGKLITDAITQAATRDDLRRASPLMTMRRVGPDTALEISAAIGRLILELEGETP